MNIQDELDRIFRWWYLSRNQDTDKAKPTQKTDMKTLSVGSIEFTYSMSDVEKIVGYLEANDHDIIDAFDCMYSERPDANPPCLLRLIVRIKECMSSGCRSAIQVWEQIRELNKGHSLNYTKD